MQENNKTEHSGTNGNMRGSKEQTKENMGRRLSDTMLNRNSIGSVLSQNPTIRAFIDQYLAVSSSVIRAKVV